MKRSAKRILPILLGIVVIFSIIWYLGVYDRPFTRDMLLEQARFFDNNGNHNIAAWFYDLAYRQSNNDDSVAIELAEQFKEAGNYTKAEYTLSNAISHGGSVELYIALCKTYVEQDKLLDAVSMLENVSDPHIRQQLSELRPKTPVANPAPGFYSQYISVAIESSSGKLYVNTNQEYPSVSTDAYTAPIQLSSGDNTIYALAVGENGLVSELAIFGYVVGGVIEEITLKDSTLDAAIRELLGKSATDPILSSELWSITELKMPQDVKDYSDLQYLTYLESLTIEKGSFTDLSALASLSYLTDLTVRDNILSSGDLATIGALPNLQNLTLENCGISSIANLSVANKLVRLDLSGNTIRDLSVLSGMTNLEALDLSRNALTGLGQISMLTGLKELNVAYNSLVSVSSLSGCTGLMILDISHNTVSSLTGLEGLKGLVTLNASHNNLTDISPLSTNTALAELNVANNSLSDIGILAGLAKLTALDFSNNSVSQLPTFATDCALVSITGSYNSISSVKNLSGLENLNHVILSYNKISSVDALAKCHHLVSVDVYGNPVKNVSALTEQGIIVHYTPV